MLLSLSGLVLSSFSLLVIQSVMGGLQNGLMTRSKNILGVGELQGEFSHSDLEALTGLKFTPEYEVEVLGSVRSRMNGMIVHGVDKDFLPPFLVGKNLNGIVLGGELSDTLDIYFHEDLRLISPAHFDRLFGKVPRSIHVNVTDFFRSELTEIDSVHAFVDLRKIQNLVRSRSFNRIRFYQDKDFSKAKTLLPQARAVSWEDRHQSLVFALSLETKVMLFLFSSMGFLVALCITSGQLIFYDRIKRDLFSFWILGQSRKEGAKQVFGFTQLMTILSCALGLALGALVLVIISKGELKIMPDFFVEQSLPVQFRFEYFARSFFIPVLISILFTCISFWIFKKDKTTFHHFLK